MKKESLLSIIIQEILLTGLFLCLFATFHHVLPRHGYLTGREAEPVAITAAPTPSPDVVSEDEPAVQLTPWQEKFSEHFSAEPVWTENSYTSPTVSVTIETFQQEIDGYPQVWYVADIYVADVRNLQTYVENDSFARFIETPAEELSTMAQAIISINGDYCNAHVQPGFYVRNGLMYQDFPTTCDICVLYYDGRMETYGYKEYKIDDVLAGEPYQVWKFGPKLLDADGNPMTSFNSTGAIAIGNPRSVIGYYEPGHYCFVTVDGRQDEWARGLTLEQLSQLMYDLGCKAAYNLDGGASATMVFNGQLFNRQSSPRDLGDILLIRELDETEEMGE